MKPVENSRMLALSALVRAHINAKTKAEMFRQSMFQGAPISKTKTLSHRANQALEDLKESLATSKQHKALFYT